MRIGISGEEELSEVVWEPPGWPRAPDWLPACWCLAVEPLPWLPWPPPPLLPVLGLFVPDEPPDEPDPEPPEFPEPG